MTVQIMRILVTSVYICSVVKRPGKHIKYCMSYSLEPRVTRLLWKLRLTASLNISSYYIRQSGTRDGRVIEALRYKPEGRGIDSRWCHWNFSLT
jgi:hypothetical protein